MYFDTNNQPVTKVASAQSAATYTPASLPVATRYYWQVVANLGGVQMPGPVWSFVTTIPGDVNADGAVNMLDLLDMATAWGSVTGGPNWDPSCDLNNDGSVDVVDLLILADYWNVAP